jgi:UDP-glucose 4-epimerase
VSKLAAEHYVRVFEEIYGLKGINLRYFTVFGPRMRPDLAINIFTRAALMDDPIEIFGTGKKTRDFTYIDNIVNATLKAVKKGSRDYNIGSGKRINILELAEKIIDLTDSSSEIVHSGDAEGDMEHTLASIKKAKKDLGYKIKVDLLEGLKRYTKWVEKNEFS